MDFYSRDVPIEELLADIDNGRIALPEFQRDFIWSPSQVVDLIRSVAKRWPTGSFLLLDGPHNFASKPIAQAPVLTGRPGVLVLDGQQRITALYHAVRDLSTEVYFVDVKALLAGGDDDEYIRFAKRRSFEANHPSIPQMAAAGVLKISTLYEERNFFEWMRFLDPELQSPLLREIDNSLSGLKRRVYRMPAVHLNKNIDLAALAKIFETLNRTGVRLDVFDLMTASLYAHGFNLRNRWNEALESQVELTKYRVSAIELLKAVALLEHVRAQEANERVRVNGVRQSDILRMKPEITISGWDRAISRYCEALVFLRTECGVLAQSLLPSSSMILTLAIALDAVPSRDAISVRRLRSWYWASAFRQQYSQGANTQVTSDARTLRAWLSNRGPAPRVLSERLVVVDELLESRRRNEILTRTMLCFFISNGAISWAAPYQVTEVADDDVLIVNLRELLGDALTFGDSDEPECIMNFVVVSRKVLQSLKQRLRDWPIRDTHEASDVFAGQCVIDLRGGGSWSDFARARASCVLSDLRELQSSFAADLSP